MRLMIANVLLTGCLLGAAGCDSPQAATADGEHSHDHDHDHGGRPESLHAAVHQLAEIRDEVRDAMAAGEPDNAHHPLHEVGDLLKVLPEVAADTDLPEAEWEKVKAEVDRLFDAFGEIDKAFHTKDGDKAGAYEGVATTIDEAIAALEALLPLSGEEPPASEEDDHDHDDHDHDHEGHDHE